MSQNSVDMADKQRRKKTDDSKKEKLIESNNSNEAKGATSNTNNKLSSGKLVPLLQKGNKNVQEKNKSLQSILKHSKESIESVDLREFYLITIDDYNLSQVTSSSTISNDCKRLKSAHGKIIKKNLKNSFKRLSSSNFHSRKSSIAGTFLRERNSFIHLSPYEDSSTETVTLKKIVKSAYGHANILRPCTPIDPNVNNEIIENEKLLQILDYKFYCPEYKYIHMNELFGFDNQGKEAVGEKMMSVTNTQNYEEAEVLNTIDSFTLIPKNQRFSKNKFRKNS